MTAHVTQMNELRADLYTFLSDAFLEELDESDLARFAERAGRDGLEFVPDEALEAAGEEEPVRLAGVELLEAFGEELRDSDPAEREDLVEDLAAEYASLFLVSGPKQVNPYEAFYLGDGDGLYQERTMEVKAIMEELGFEKATEHPEPEDHVGNELAFLRYLACQAHQSLDTGEIEYARRYLNLQKEFVEKHLLKWAPQLCADVVERTDSDFYEALALMTADVLEQEPAMLQYMMEALQEAEA